MRSTSEVFVVVLLALCFLGLCQSSPRSKRTKTGSKEREHCQLPSDAGSCSSKLRRWFYDPATEDCKTFTWTGCEGNDNRFRSRGQCERSCKGGASLGGAHTEDDVSAVKVKPTSVARCRRLPCKGLNCHHGYERGFDDNGCHTCQCRSLPMTTAAAPFVETCPEVNCPGKICPKGFRLDDHGCMTCQCLGCPTLSCPSHLNCRDGYAVDMQNGCERCECKDAWNSGRLYPDAAEVEMVTDKERPVGKKEIMINAWKNSFPVTPAGAQCPDPIKCFLQCSEGFAVDAAGCELCACQKTGKAPPPGDELMCRPVECDISCRSGYAMDENGCEICKCAGKDEKEADGKKKNCPKTTCAPECQLKVDETGCPVCVCKEDDVMECDRTALTTCSMICPGGFDRDSRGCEICECRPLADEKSRDGVSDFVTCAPFDDKLCADRCEFFIIRQDKNGCDGCHCPSDESEFTTPALEHDCPALFECTLDCPEDLERDDRGCEICMCRKPEVDERLDRTGIHDPEVTGESCPAIDCLLPCRLESGEECARCVCEEPTEVSATQFVTACPDHDCVANCPGGYQTDDETGCASCACVDDQQTGSGIVVTSDPFATRDSAVDDSEEEFQTPPYATSSDSMPEALTTAADLDLDFEGPSTTTTGYPAEVMCSGRSCNKKCINGLVRNEGEECFICECNQESRTEKRLVDVSIVNARKGICSLPAYKGPCHATLTRWNFNSQTGTCESFDYGGCRGYANNFRSKESCVEFCVPEVNEERATRQARFREALRF